MIFIKNRLIFGLIGKIIKTVFKVIYKFLAFFNLHITMLVGVVGAILYFTGVFNSTPQLLTAFYVALILSVVFAIINTIKKLLGLGKKVQKKGSIQIVSTTEQESPVESSKPESQTQMGLPDTTPVKEVADKPIRRFFASSNTNVLITEYQDRYVLFIKTKDGYKYLRTDNK